MAHPRFCFLRQEITMSIRLTVRTYHDRKPQGGAATALTDSLRYEIVVSRGDLSVVLREFDQFDAENGFLQDQGAFESKVQMCVSRCMSVLDLTEYRIEHYQPRVVMLWDRTSEAVVAWESLPRTTKRA
jgi:hypothetical protein